MTISVTQLNNYVRGLLDIDGVLNSLSVCGEITNLKKSRDGWYFSLKDEAASVNCFCYDSVAVPEQGNVVVAEGQLNYFVKSGSVSFCRNQKYRRSVFALRRAERKAEKRRVIRR